MSLGLCLLSNRFFAILYLLGFISFFNFSLSYAQQAGFEWNFNTESNVAGYRVYLGISPGQYNEIIDVGFTRQYFLNDPQEGTTYFCSVSAYDFLGNESPLSEEVSLTIPRLDSSLLLYNGEEVGIGKTARAKEIDGFHRAAQEHMTFQIAPTQWHKPRLTLPRRTDFRDYEFLEFFYKSETEGETHTLQLIDWGPYQGETVNIEDFIEGGTITTSYRKVSIPLSALRSAAFDLSTVYTFVFGTNSKSALFYMTDICLLGQQTHSHQKPLLQEPPHKAERVSVLATGNPGSITELQITPTKWHQPIIWLEGRTNFNAYEVLEFQFKSNIEGQKETLQLLDWGPYIGSKVNIEDYIVNQTISTVYQKVSIPLTALRSESFDLSSVFTFRFGTNSASAQFFITDVVLKGEEVLEYHQPLFETNPSYVERVTIVDDPVHFGPRALQIEPTQWHKPLIWLPRRTDFTKYDVLEFLYKSSQEGESHTLQLIDWGTLQSKTVKIEEYIEGGSISTNYKKVTIPLSAFKSEAFDLSSVYTFVFGTNSNGSHFIIDDIQLNHLLQPS